MLAGKQRPISDKTFLESCKNGFTFELEWIQLNDRKYVTGLMILHENVLYEIKRILISNSQYYFVTLRYCFTGIDKFTNAFKIKKLEPEMSSIVTFDPCNLPNLYEIKSIDNELYIPATNLEIQHAFDQTQ